MYASNKLFYYFLRIFKEMEGNFFSSHVRLLRTLANSTIPGYYQNCSILNLIFFCHQIIAKCRRIRMEQKDFSPNHSIWVFVKKVWFFKIGKSGKLLRAKQYYSFFHLNWKFLTKQFWIWKNEKMFWRRSIFHQENAFSLVKSILLKVEWRKICLR